MTQERTTGVGMAAAFLVLLLVAGLVLLFEGTRDGSWIIGLLMILASASWLNVLRKKTQDRSVEK